jgi:hypothetical protein
MRHHPIKDNHIRRILFNAKQPLFAILGAGDAKAFGL